MKNSVRDQCDPNQFFSLSTIDKEVMAKVGLNMTVKELKERARKANWFTEIPTGDFNVPGRVRNTKIYRYVDFLEAK